MTNYLDDIVALLGLAALFYGCWLVYVPAAWIVTGLLLIAVSLLRARAHALRGAKE